MIRKIISLGKYSGVVSIPRELMKKLGWRRGQNVEVSANSDSLKVKDFKN
ncbi:MAG: AbrB/MazE/SpoVT family DNA-binding domain-containing protein [Candidatus Daviesbacteria bacterium]|nr:AbrB/MazE/SpoVT family DNA-binding domain-containing protein [Candidatus Daviesbacteria bacterium]